MLGHIIPYTSHKTSDTGIQQRALAGALPAFLCFPAREHPKCALRCNLILQHLYRRTAFLLTPCQGQCLLPAPTRTTRYYNSTAPDPACSHFCCICPCCCPCACGKGDLPSALAESSPCPAHEVMAKASLVSF